jgi:hypothetical protein
MMETLYVPGSPVWTGIPPTGFGWVQTGIPMSGLGAGPALGPPPQLPQMAAGQILADAIGSGRSGATMPSPPTPFHPFGYAPGFLGAEFTSAIPATALLAAVAMRRGQPQGPTNDTEVEEFLYDALELLTGAIDVEVRNDVGRVTLTGSVPHKRLKRDIGEIAWAIPGVTDVQNNLAITARRRSRSANREPEAHPNAPVRNPA